MVGVTAFDDNPGPYRVAVRKMDVSPLAMNDEGSSGHLGEDGSAVGVWGFEGVAGAVVSVTVSSDAFDPVVELLSPAGEQVADDDDSGPGTDARLLATLPETGTYVVGVTAFDDKPGPYRVAVQTLDAQELEIDNLSSGVLR